MRLIYPKLTIYDKIPIILLVFVFLFEFCFPFKTQAIETRHSTELGPVFLTLKSDKAEMLKSMESLKDAQPKFVRWVTVTAYSSTVDQCDDSPFISANGSLVYDGMVAANFLYFGTKVKFPDYFGDKVFTVEDRMNKKYNSRVDVWMPTREQAKEFGVRYLKIEVY